MNPSTRRVFSVRIGIELTQTRLELEGFPEPVRLNQRDFGGQDRSGSPVRRDRDRGPQSQAKLRTMPRT